MAINKKLIHFDMTKQLFMSNANGLNNLTKPTNGIVGNIPYYSVVFLKDGYIWTHGHFINGTGIADSVSSNATISWSKITDKPSTFTPSAHTQSYTTLTGSGTTANQAIVSSGTANGWVLKTLGSRAFDSTSYLPLTGGTLTGNLILKGNTTDNMTYSGNIHPYIRFDNSDSDQNVSLIFTDYDSYRSPAGLKLVGNQGNEWFEAPAIYQNGTKVSVEGHTHDRRYLRNYHRNDDITSTEVVNADDYIHNVGDTGGSSSTMTKPSGMDNAWGILHMHLHTGNYSMQLGFGGTTGHMYFRNAYNSSTFSSWKTLIDSDNIGSQSVASATKLQTARTLWGQSFDGTANVSGNMTGVGSISASGDISSTSRFVSGLSTCTHIQGLNGSRVPFNSTAPAGYNMVLRVLGTGGAYNVGAYFNSFDLIYGTQALIDAGTNSYTHAISLMNLNGLTMLKNLVVDGKNHLNENTSASYRLYVDGTSYMSNGLTLAGGLSHSGTSGNFTWGNITIYGGGSNGGVNSLLVGDDVTIGDCNVSGAFGMKSTGNNAGFRFFNSSGTSIGGIQSTNGTLQWINSSGTAYNIITAANIGSQSVNYATSTGNADTVDNYHAIDISKSWYTLCYSTYSSSDSVGIVWHKIATIVTSSSDKIENDFMLEIWSYSDQNYASHRHGFFRCTSYGTTSTSIVLSTDAGIVTSSGAPHIYATIDSNRNIWIGIKAYYTCRTAFRMIQEGNVNTVIKSNFETTRTAPNSTYITDNGYLKKSRDTFSSGKLSLPNVNVDYATSAGSATKATQDSDGSQINTTYAKLASPNNLVHASNEITMIPDSYNGDLWINYQSVGRDSSANVTGYIFGNGKGGQLAKITNGQFSGNAATSTNADKLDGYHYNNLPYHPSNGSWKPSSLSSYTRHWGWAYNSAEAGLASNGTEMQIYTDGKFWQREGAYYCLDNGNTYVSSGIGVINGTIITQVANADTVDDIHASEFYNENYGSKWTRLRISNTETSWADKWIKVAVLNCQNPGTYTASKIHGYFYKHNGNWEFAQTYKIPFQIIVNFTGDTAEFYYSVLGSTANLRLIKLGTRNYEFQVKEGSHTEFDIFYQIVNPQNVTGYTEITAGTTTYVSEITPEQIESYGNYAYKSDTLDGYHASAFSLTNHNHDGRYLRDIGTVGTGNALFDVNIDPGVGTITYDPIAANMGTAAESNPNVTALNLGNSFARRKQLLFMWDNDNIYYRRHRDNTWTTKVKLLHTGNISPSLDINGNTIRVTTGEINSSYITVPYATNTDTVDGYHESSFLRHRVTTSTNQEGTLWSQIGIKQYNGALPDSLSGTYNWGQTITFATTDARFEIYASHLSSDNQGLYYRSGWDNDKKPWRHILDSYNSSVGKSGETLTVTINGTAQSLTNTNTWRGITDAYNPATADSAISLSQKGAKNLFNVLTFSAGRWGWSGNGSHEICLIATIDTNAIYMNYPITFEISGRSMALTHITIAFENSSFVDPAVDYFCTDYSTRFYLYKSATNTWKLYGSSPDGVWGSLYLYRVKGGSYGRVTVNMESVSALPEGCQTPTFIGNVSYATKATQDSDGNAINTTYLKRSGGSMTNTNVVTNLNADTVDSLHGSNLVRFFLSPMDSGAPADSAKSWFTKTMPSASGAIVYNVPGAEKTIIAGKSSGAYGHMLQLNYDDTYLRILRYYGGNWKSTDWEKISAGYADSAGSASSATKATQDSDGNQINTTYIKKGGNQTACPNGTAITSPGGANILSIRTAATSGTDVGIFHLSDDNAYICNSSDNCYTFAVFDTDLTKDFSSEDTASFCVQSNGNGCKIRGNTVIHTGNYSSYALPKSGGNMTGHIYLTGAVSNSSTSNTSQIVFGTNSDNHVAISSNSNALIINPSTGSTNNQIVLGVGNVNSSFMTNVGIGTASPSYKLDVNGTLHANDATTLSSTLYVGNNATIAGTLGVYGTTTLKSATTIEANTYISGETFFSAVDAFRLNYGSYGVIHRNDGGSYWILLTDKNDQNGGFNSLRPFHIDFSNGTVHMDNNAIIDNLAFTQCNISMGGRVNATWGYDINSSDYYGLYFKSKNSSSTGILFNDDGNVGIGTTSPLRKLHVIGEAIFGEAGYVASQGTGSNYSGTWVGTGFMELSSPNPFIDFHGNMSTADYTSRLIQWGDKVRLKYENSNGVYSGYVLTCEGNHHNPVILGIFDLKRSGPGSKVWTLDNICGPCVFTLANNWGSDVNSNSNTYWTIPSNLLRVEINGVLGDNYTTKTTVKAAACIGTVMTRWMNNQPIVSNRSHEDIAGCSVECLCTDKAPGTNLYYDSNSPGKYIYITGAKPYGYDEGTNGLSMDQFRSTGHLSYQRVRFVVYGWLE